MADALSDVLIKQQLNAYDVERQHQTGSDEYEIVQQVSGTIRFIVKQILQYSVFACDSFILDKAHNSILHATAAEAFVIDDFESTGNWTSADTLANDTTAGHFWVGSQGIKDTWVATSGTRSLSYTGSSKDLATVTGVASGAPSRGTIGIWVYLPVAASQSTFKLDIGNDSSNHRLYAAILTTPLQAGLNYLRFDLDGASTNTGTVTWNAIDYIVLSFVVSAAGNVTFDYFTCNQDDVISFNGFGLRTMTTLIYDSEA